ncbi:hypothetical protein ILYODFUR_008909 [Ilyodon furcidens]|uniref:C-type lectin domain-containing protein n=1 Tax=Ilyodon furcidens TaxID=33524 RepID=A0ABV0T6G7_9TELE
MPEADLTYADVKFIRPRSRDNVASEDITYSEVKISNNQKPANIQQAGSSRRSKVTSERLVLLVLIALLVAALIALGFTLFDKIQMNQTVQSLKEENEALRKNQSEIKPKDASSTPTCPPPPTFPKPQTCPPPLGVKCETCLKKRPEWEPHGGNCYKFNTRKSSWNESRRSCKDQGGDLVKIDSREEQMFLEIKLRDLMEEPEDKFWIGLTDSGKQGSWLWVDGSPLDERLMFWSNGEPDNWIGLNPAGEDCVRMGERGGTHDLKCWFDQSCDFPQKSICEKATSISPRVCL